MRDADQKDFDYLAARVHGRRSRLAEGSTLDRLSQVRAVPELCRALALPPEISALDLQRTLAREAFEEVSELAACLSGAAGRLLEWLRVRYQVENLKVLVRGALAGRSAASLEPYLLPVPEDLRLPGLPRETAEQPGALASILPAGPIRDSLAALVAPKGVVLRPFDLEAAIDRGYLGELLRRARCIGGDEGTYLLPMAYQDADLFHLALAVRGIWIHRLEPERLAPFHVRGAGLSRQAFDAMLRAQTWRRWPAWRWGGSSTRRPPRSRTRTISSTWRGTGSFDWPMLPFAAATWGWRRWWPSRRCVAWNWRIS